MTPQMCVCGHPQSLHQTGRGGLNLTGDQFYGLCLVAGCGCREYCGSVRERAAQLHDEALTWEDTDAR